MELIKETKLINELTSAEIKNIFLLTKPYYLDSSSVVKRELKHNNVIYLLKNDSSVIVAFFMVVWEKMILLSEEREVVYLGLSCASQDNQEDRFASKVYYNFTIDAYNHQQQNNTKLILYGTTATPVVLLTLPKIWDNVKPGLDGSYSQVDLELIECLKIASGLNKFSADHPFVLKRVAVNTRYSIRETQRLKEFEQRNDLTIFENLNINEADGDRLLITCNIPDKEKIEALEIKLFS